MPTLVFTGQMIFLLPNQECQSTEGNWMFKDTIAEIYMLYYNSLPKDTITSSNEDNIKCQLW